MSLKSLIILCVAVIGSHSCIAQAGVRHIYKRPSFEDLPKDTRFFVIPPDSLWSDMPWKDSTYLFPQFGVGKVEFKNGYSAENHLAMNYNIFFETIVFRQEDGNVIPFQYNKELKYIWIDDHKFIYSKSFGFLEIVLDGRVAVAESTFMDVIVEYPSASQYSSNPSEQRYQVSKTKRSYYEQKRFYILETSSGRLYPAAPGVLPRIFHKEGQTIRDFEKQNGTDYNKKDDLLKIVLFCNREL